MRTRHANAALVAAVASAIAIAIGMWALSLRAQQATYSVKRLTPETALAAAQAAWLGPRW